jgi:hypothetical protein
LSQEFTRGFVSSVVIDNQMPFQFDRRFGVDALQKANEFLVTLLGHAIPNHLPVQHVQGGEQRGRSVAL